jgi:nicotinamide-nucleotide amidase
MAKNAEIIAIGSELLTPDRVDTNSLIVTDHLNGLGVEVIQKLVIGDDRELLTEAIRTALSRVNIVVLIGGLGPTEDDVTRDAAAAALGRPLLLSAEQESILIKRFRSINRPMAQNNLRQAYLIEGAEALPNPNGTAPGQFLFTDHGAIALLPGPPRELRPMVEQQLVPRLLPVLPRQVIRVRTFRITGIGESDLDTLIAPVYSKYTNPTTTVLSSPGDLHVHLRARCETAEEAEALLREVGNPIAELLGDRVYSEKPDDTLDTVVARLLFCSRVYHIHRNAEKTDSGRARRYTQELFSGKRTGGSGDGGRRQASRGSNLWARDNRLCRACGRNRVRSGRHCIYRDRGTRWNKSHQAPLWR